MGQVLLFTLWSVRCTIRGGARTLVKVLIPPCVLLVMVVLRVTMQQSQGCDEFVSPQGPHCLYTPFSPLDIVPHLNRSSVIRYAPIYYSEIMEGVSRDLGVPVKMYESEDQILEAIQDNRTLYESTLAAVIFSVPSNAEQRYSIRMKSWLSLWRTDKTFPFIPTPGPRSSTIYPGAPLYFQTGFLALQSSVDSHLSRLNLSKDVTLQKFPHSEYSQDNYLAVIPVVLPLLLLISYGLLSADLVRDIVHQKHFGMKEFLSLNRLSRTSYWTSWYLIALFLFIPTTALNLTVLYAGNAIQYSDFTLVTLFLVLFVLTAIALSFFLSCYAQTPMTAMMWSVVLWLIMYAPFFFVESNFEGVDGSVKMMLCLLPPLALGMGCRLIGVSEMTGEGLNWDNYTSSDMGISFQIILLMLLLDCVLYCFGAVYVDATRPGKYGYAEGWNFCLSALGTRAPLLSKLLETTPLLSVNYSNKEKYQNLPRSVRVGVDVRTVRKEYYDRNQVIEAVGMVDIKICEGEITAILGPNGCGKSTLLAMIAGILPPTEGDILVAGIPMKEAARTAQENISYMPQTEPLVDQLSVREHLVFFGKLRGLSSREADVHTEETLHLLGLAPLADFRAGQLSGGQRRKLSLGIALVSNSPVLILDEPMAGMDVENRALVSSVLQKIKLECTIIICTHSVEEASVMADRIGIMTDNKLHCYGSSQYIKTKFGIGYSLVVEKGVSCNESKITQLVLTAIPMSTIASNDAKQITYTITKDMTKTLTMVLAHLEAQSEALGIKSLSISENTLDEAYAKLVEGSTAEVARNRVNDNKGSGTAKKISSLARGKAQRGSYLTKTTQEERAPMKPPCCIVPALWAILVKNVKQYRHHWFLALAMVLLPVLFTILMFLVLKIGQQTDFTLPFPLWISSYSPSTVPYDTEEMALKRGLNSTIAGTGSHIVDIAKFKEGYNMTDFLLMEQNELGKEFRKEYIAGLEMWPVDNSYKMKAHFSDSAVHGSPTALSLAHNTYIRTMRNNNPNHIRMDIRTVNEPLPPLAGEGRMGSSIAMMTLYLLGVSFLVSLSVIIPAAEINTGVKHLQQFSGLSSQYFWLGAYLVVVVLALVSSLLCALTVLLTQEPAFFGGSRYVLIWLVTLLYFLAGVPLAFLIASFSKKPTVAFALTEMLNKGLGFVTVVVVGVFYLEDVDMAEVADGLSYVFALLPSFSAAQAMSDLYKNYKLEQRCLMGACREDEAHVPYLSLTRPGIGFHLVMLASCSVMYLVLLMVHEGWLQKLKSIKIGGKVRIPLSSLLEEDDGVSAERNRVFSEESKRDPLKIKSLHKTHMRPDGPFVALQDLTLGVQAGETFGLLGSNGAGKSTTFRILTAADEASGGSVHYKGVAIKDNKSPPNVGYCPQFPALIDALSVRQHMVLFARIKDQSEEWLVRDIVKIMQLMGLLEVADVCVVNLSLGNKKKLGVALALIGVPEVLLLDEPTTGLDMEGRKLLVGLLLKMRAKGTATLITSHNMQESEDMCTRVGILTNGSLQCVGSLEDLNERFGNYSTLILTLIASTQDEMDARMATVGAFISRNYPGSEIKTLRERTVTYALPQQAIQQWSALFTLLEENKRDLGIEEYCISKASLQQVYLSIVRQQRDGLGGKLAQYTLSV